MPRPGGAEIRYGLGVTPDAAGSQPRVQHDGGWTGFLSSNRVYPAARAAVAVCINAGFSNGQEAIADATETIVLPETGDAQQIRALLEMPRSGPVDRARLTANGNFYFSATALDDYRATLTALGPLRAIERHKPKTPRGGLATNRYVLTSAARRLQCVIRSDPASGRIEQGALHPFVA